jgi:aminoglycoside phosphotransferase family enzyme/predicted kinase
MDGTQRQSSLSPPQDLPELIAALTRPIAYPVPPTTPVVVAQTHASLVMLAGEYAYKLKKARDFGFFDYSTPGLRRHFCAQEAILNARLAPHVYLGVAPVLVRPNGVVAFGSISPPATVPMPGAALPGGRVMDYAVVMRRLPEEATLAARVQHGDVSVEQVEELARRVAAFHAQARADADVARFGGPETITANWEENLAQMRPFVGRALTQAGYSRIEAFVRSVLSQRTRLLLARVEGGRIRDCHGDLRLEHVYFLDGTPTTSERIVIVDCIEFNERFRCGDVTAEVAFLVMELDAAGRRDLARAFVDAYVAASGDEELRELLPFYCCYRACVRGKVAAFQLDEFEVPAEQRTEAAWRASMLFALAEQYATSRTRQGLVLIGGLMGTGKSTVAHALRTSVGFALFSSDATRKRLAGLDPMRPIPAGYGVGIYSDDWSARTYETLLLQAREALETGRSAVLDASFGRRRDRLAAARLATEYDADAFFIETTCAPEQALARLAGRWNARLGGGARDASDGRPALYAQQAAAWEPFDAHAESKLTHVLVPTDQSMAASRAQALDALGLLGLVCWLDGKTASEIVQHPLQGHSSSQRRRMRRQRSGS